jgi:nucleoside-diphosphate-sugar epimerase
MNESVPDTTNGNETVKPAISGGTVLVTGAAGLVGTELVSQLLEKGYRVKALYNKTPLRDFQHKHLVTVHCDLLDIMSLEEAMQDVESVYHCAGYISFSPRKRRQLLKVNVEATANVVNVALQAGIKKLLHVSSVAALGRLRKEEINENMQWSPATSNSVYAQSKYMGEMEVWRGIAEGLEAVIVNPTIILGAGNWEEGSTEIFKSVYDGFPWYAEGVTGFVDVRDVCDAMIRLMESGIRSERFIINAENAMYRDVFNQIADAFHKKRPARKITPLLASLAWRMEAVKSKFTGKDPLVTKETANTAFAISNFSNEKLKKFIPGFQYHSLKDSIIYTCDLLQQKLNIR